MNGSVTDVGFVSAKPSSFNFDIHGAGVKFLDAPLSPDNIGLITSNNNVYFTNITLGGLNLTVQLDTGSSDLWVNIGNRELNLRGTSSLQTNITFGIGSVQGNISFADLQLGDFTIENQAFLDATQTIDQTAAKDGVIGMSFNTISSIFNTVEQAQGTDAASQIANTPIISLFLQQPNLPFSFDVQLGRTDVLNDVAQGVFLIGEHDENFQQVAAAPQLPSVSDEHWSVVMDAMNINGEPFTFNASRIDGVPQGKLAAMLDTGFSFPPIPGPAVDAIYGSIPGAVRVAADNSFGWIVPCNASTNLSFVFAGQEFFVHPLDLAEVTVSSFPTADGTMQNMTVCLSTFQPDVLDPTEFTGFDLILGDSFLRNVYASFNYGSAEAGVGPFVQMVSTTPDISAAITQFQSQRAATLAQLPPTIDPADVAKLLESNGTIQPSATISQNPQSTSSPVQTTAAAPAAKPSNGSISAVAVQAGLLCIVSFLTGLAALL
ncbi:aspartic peptidase domain-containing protein [Trametes punicea]|nr:aspartic peptidase domain-containing protein [Trametes punicea]